MSSIRIDHDELADTVTICGVKYAVSLFEAMGAPDSVMKPFRIISNNDGVVTLQQLNDYDALVAEVARLKWEVDKMQGVIRYWQARYDSATNLLTGILFHLPAPAVRLEDGRVAVFVDPDPRQTLNLIQSSLQRAVDAQINAAAQEVEPK